ncbi:putative flowering time control protein FCA-like isoform X1, partial [Capsicum annuum]
MASNPPFIVEDQTDEDFFDKLVNDDDDDVNVVTGFKLSGSGLSPGPLSSSVYVDGNESDEVKGFGDLIISDDTEKVGNGVGSNVNLELVVEGNGEESSGKITGLGPNECNEVKAFADLSISDDANSGVDSNAKPGDSSGNLEAEVNAGKTESHASGTSSSGVKEVGWSAFNADPVTNDGSGFGSYMDFFSELGDSNNNGDATGKAVLPAEQVHEAAYVENTSSLTQGQDGYGQHDATTEQVVDGQDVNSSQYWENLYPGWKYDASTGQWYQVDGYESGGNVQGITDSNLVNDGTAEVSYLQSTAQSVSGTAAESGTTESVTNWNQVSQLNDASTGNVPNWKQTDWNQASQLNNGYPSHMVFDPQYPGWYYDTNALEWRSLESYTPSAQPTVQAESQLDQNVLASQQTFSHNSDQQNYGAYGHNDNSRFQGFSSGGGDYNWSASSGNYNQHQHSSYMSQNENVARSNPMAEYRGNQQLENNYNQDFSASSHVNKQISNHYEGTVPYNANAIQSQNDQRFFSGGGFGQQFSQPTLQKHEQKHASSDYYGNQTTVNYSQQAFQSSQQFAHAPDAGKSSAGRPPHALVTFGFGGKLIVMKDHSSFGNPTFGSQNPVGGSIAVLNLMDVVSERADCSSLVMGACDYTRALCRQPFPGPLVGGSPSIKELNKWIDERIANAESPDMDYRKGEVLRLLLSLLKIACQYYGKLRSPFGTEAVLK